MITLEELIRLAEKQARHVLIGTKEELTPSWVLVDWDGKPEIFATPWEGNGQKHLVTRAMREIMRARQIEAYSILVECWFAMISKEEMGKEYTGPMPSERADRREGVLVTAVHRDGRSLHQTWEIVRNEKGTCVELRRIDGAKGEITSEIFDNLLETRRPN